MGYVELRYFVPLEAVGLRKDVQGLWTVSVDANRVAPKCFTRSHENLISQCEWTVALANSGNKTDNSGALLRLSVTAAQGDKGMFATASMRACACVFNL